MNQYATRAAMEEAYNQRWRALQIRQPTDCVCCDRMVPPDSTFPLCGVCTSHLRFLYGERRSTLKDDVFDYLNLPPLPLLIEAQSLPPGMSSAL